MPRRVTPNRILLMGLVKSIRELHEGVLQSMQQLCSFYDNHQKANATKLSFVDVHIVHQQSGMSLSNLQSKLLQASCSRVTFITEEDLFQHTAPQGSDHWIQKFSSMSRFEKIAALRSLQRRQVLQSNYAYDVVINFDTDLLRLPPLTSIVQAIEMATKSTAGVSPTTVPERSGTIVCANGYEETPAFPVLGSSLYVYYDTFASVDTFHFWYYEIFSQWSPWQWTNPHVRQAMVFHDILQYDQQHDGGSSLWPMQSCFGGLAVYDFTTWAYADCDYDQSNIGLTMQPSNKPWQLSSRYVWKDNVCEHTVFQQCLLAASQQQNLHSLMIGVQPSLIAERQSDHIFVDRALQFIFLIIILLQMRKLNISYRCLPHRFKNRRQEM